jgi:hypothetical protein
VTRPFRESGKLARGDPLPSFGARSEQLPSDRVELAVQVGDEGESVRRQHPRVGVLAAAEHLDVAGRDRKGHVGIGSWS